MTLTDLKTRCILALLVAAAVMASNGYALKDSVARHTSRHQRAGDWARSGALAGDGSVDSLQDAEDAEDSATLRGGLVPPVEIVGLNRTPGQQELFRHLARFDLEHPFDHDADASFHAHGEKVCASGCAASRHPTETLGEAEFRQWMDQLDQTSLDEHNLAFESLLYHGRQTSDWLLKLGTCGIAPEAARRLHAELQKTHVLVEIRLTDEFGEVRSWLPPTRVPLDRRHVFTMRTRRLQPLVTSGTVKRVGLDHLWTRL